MTVKHNQGPKGPVRLALEAKLAVQHVPPVVLPRTLVKELDLGDVWAVTPGGEEGRLSEHTVQVPIGVLTARLQALVG